MAEKPPSLAQLFEAPDGYVGSFGWLCGYTADARFLNDAAERFTQQTLMQRAHLGKISLGLMLDSHCPQIRPADSPGIAHMPMREPTKRPFLLLHAKVALLAFRHVDDATTTSIRLIVSTGNWTEGTLQESLDLAWCVELRSAEHKTSDVAVRQVRTDIANAWDLLRWLQPLFDTRIVSSEAGKGYPSETSDACQSFSDLLDRVRPARGYLPRFFDSRKRALLSQLPSLVKHHGSGVARNYLAMGSGFYETAGRPGAVPSVLLQIVDKMQAERLLTKSPEVGVFVNRDACQAVAKALPAVRAQGWTVREAYKPEYFGRGVERSLHAKFIFSANQRRASNNCNSAWLYLGSGNLTGPGLAARMSRSGGNLEAGVVFAPRDLCWEQRSRVPAHQVVSNVLPIHWDEEIEALEELATGPDYVPNTDVYASAPIGYLVWVADIEHGHLEVVDGDSQSFELLSLEGLPCERLGEIGFRWVDECPRQVKVRWVTESGEEWTAYVAVLDKQGRVAATSLPELGIDDVWWQLEHFPMAPEEEEIEADGSLAGDRAGEKQGVSATHRGTDYPIRRMMQLIENIAAKQTEVAASDWNTWCTRLEQVMVQAARCGVAEMFAKLKVNPLSPLRAEPFRPTFAETTETPEGQRYEYALSRIETEWEVGELSSLGVAT
jgi:hypothetical protein